MPGERESPPVVIRIPDPVANTLSSPTSSPTPQQRAERARRVGLATTDGYGVFFGVVMAVPALILWGLGVKANPWLACALVPALVWVAWRVRRAGRRRPRRQ